MIDKVSGINPINNIQSTNRTKAPGKTAAATDQITVSAEAKKLADEYYLNQVADETPDVRAELVEKIKQKIQDPNYLNSATISATADKILSAYGF